MRNVAQLLADVCKPSGQTCDATHILHVAGGLTRRAVAAVPAATIGSL
jgi:hypothetical protein